jgi:hypothetical protein
MATGDQNDMAARIKAVLPPWFGAPSPILDALLAGIGAIWAFVYSLLAYVTLQTRIATATGIFLDMISLDFFGDDLPRNPGETDTAFRARIDQNILSPRATRAALSQAVLDLTGLAPVIFEPTRPADTGSYNQGGAGYGVAGGWGDLDLPFQCFVTAYRPRENGIANVAGWNGGGGYGVGPIEYADLTLASLGISDADIDAAIAAVMPAASIAWTRISN